VTDLTTALRTRERLERERVEATSQPPHWRVVRVKNRFERPLLHGYRDLLLSLRVRCPSGAHHVCELQARHPRPGPVCVGGLGSTREVTSG
jgi:hypothetical protein